MISSRYCKKCGELFEPISKFNYICLKCNKKSSCRINALVKLQNKLKQENKKGSVN